MSIDYRYEIKFVLDNSGLSSVMNWIYSYTFARKKYEKRKVNNLYVDDVYFSSAKDNLAGVSDRRKMRLRWYGKNSNISQFFFEIKKRNDRIGYKKTYSLDSLQNNSIKLDINNLLFECRKELEKQQVFFDDPLVPTLNTSYDREYYSDMNGVRITIDQNIHFYRSLPNQKLNISFPLSYPYKVMEIKFEPNLKNRVAELIKPLHITPRRHSKYLVGLAMLGDVVYI